MAKRKIDPDLRILVDSDDRLYQVHKDDVCPHGQIKGCCRHCRYQIIHSNSGKQPEAPRTGGEEAGRG